MEGKMNYKPIYEEEIDGDKIVIRSFEDTDAAAVAKLWNESEESWDNTSFATADSILEQARREKSLYWLLTLNSEVIGVCTIIEHEMENYADIGVINLHPKHHCKSLGRKLLLQAVKYVIDAGFERLDLFTWAGNTKAVPPYKKTGFFWMPGTGVGPGEGIWVYMQNYLPAIMSFPIAKDFFQKHPDWYDSFQRDITLKEDDIEERGMNAFVYRWEENEEKLKATVDRESFSICGVEDDRISVLCWPTAHEAPAGFSQKIKWQVKNKTEKRIQCSLLVSSEEGIEIIKRPIESFTVEPLQDVTLEGEVKIDPKTKKKESAEDEHEPAHKIETKLFIDGTLIPLTNGIRVESPIDLSFNPSYYSGYPGSRGELKVTLKSNLKQKVEGVLSVVPHPPTQISPINQTFKISEEGYVGVTFKIKIPETTGTMVMPLRFYITISTDKGEIRTKEETFPVKCFTAGGVLAAVENDGKILALENEVTRVTIKLHGGRLNSFYGKLMGRHYASSLNDAIGPPFSSPETERKDFSYQIFKEDGKIRVRLYADLDTLEGLRIIKDVTLFPSTEMVKIQYSFINSSSKVAHDFQLSVGTSVKMSETRVVVPLKQGILSTLVDGDFPDQEQADIPENPESFSETWFCLEYPKTDEVFGVLWHTENVVKNKNGATEFIFKPEILQPQSSITLKPLYLIGGFGTWRRVRELWRRFIKGETRKDVSHQRVTSLVEVDLKPWVLDFPERTEAKVVVKNNRGKALSGHLALKPPKGWTIEPSRFKIENADLANPYRKNVVLSPKTKMGPGVYQGKTEISTNLTTIKNPFHLLVLGERGCVDVRREKEENDVFLVDNGRLILKVCPGFAGTAFSLVDKETGVNHLLSAFPKPKPYGGQNLWFGGMRFTAWKNLRYNRLYKEKFQCEKAERDGWTGLKVSTSPGERVKDLKGIILEGYYLTKPGSNVISRILRVDNQTSARMKFSARQDVFVQVGGTIEDNVAYFQKDGKVLTRKRIRGMPPWIRPDENWLQVTNKKTEDSLVTVSAATNQRSWFALKEWGLKGVNLSLITNVLVDPNRPVEILSSLVLAKGPEAYEDYKCLEKYLMDKAI